MCGTTCRTDIPEVGASPWATPRHCRLNGAAAVAGEDDVAAADDESGRLNWRTNRLTDVAVVDREATVVATSH